jgi:hypothetical protein
MSQESMILDDLKKGKRITAMVALHKFHCFRLAARIRDLRDSGYAIQSRMVDRGGKRVAEYWLN